MARSDRLAAVKPLLARLFGGAAGVFPALVALLLFNKTAYGSAASVLAVALLIAGPLNSFLTQYYLRHLVAIERSTDSGHGNPLHGVISYMLIISIGLFLTGYFGSLNILVAGQAFVLASLSIILKVIEVILVSEGRAATAILVSYGAAPSLQATLMFLGIFLFKGKDFLIVSISQVGAYSLAVSIGLAVAPTARSSVCTTIAQVRFKVLIRQSRAGAIFYLNGGILAAADQLPIILLKYFSFTSVIPGYEVARKLASVPSIFVNALSSHYNPSILRHSKVAEYDKMIAAATSYGKVLSIFGLGYVATLLVISSIFQRSGYFHSIPVAILEILLVGAIVTTLSAPFGSILIACRGERWWLIGAMTGLMAFTTVSLCLASAWPVAGVAWGSVANTAVLSIIVCFGAIKSLRELMRGEASA